MMEIKVGDTVERVEGSHCGMRIGDTATVSQVDSIDSLQLKDFRGVHAASNFKVIARQGETTRPTEKTVADKQEGEKWTHGIPPNGIYCKVNHGGEFVNSYLIGRDDMGAFVYRIDGQYYSTMSESNLKPIKPTLTKGEQEKIAQFIARVWSKNNPDLRAEFDAFCNEHDITD